MLTASGRRSSNGWTSAKATHYRPLRGAARTPPLSRPCCTTRTAGGHTLLTVSPASRRAKLSHSPSRAGSALSITTRQWYEPTLSRSPGTANASGCSHRFPELPSIAQTIAHLRSSRAVGTLIVPFAAWPPWLPTLSRGSAWDPLVLDVVLLDAPRDCLRLLRLARPPRLSLRRGGAAELAHWGLEVGMLSRALRHLRLSSTIP